MDRVTAEPRVEDLPGRRAREWVARQGAVAAPSTYLYEFVRDRPAPAVGPFCADVDRNVLMDSAFHVAAAPLGNMGPKLAECKAAFNFLDSRRSPARTATSGVRARPPTQNW